MFESILDNDLYKFTIQQAILEKFPEVLAAYSFINRGGHKFTQDMVDRINEGICKLRDLELSFNEQMWLKHLHPYFKSWYAEYLYNYRYNPRQVRVSLNENDELTINILGYWHETVLWEVPLMAIICESFYGGSNTADNYAEVNRKTNDKFDFFDEQRVKVVDFGTRRRRGSDLHYAMVDYAKEHSSFAGTSNVHLAMTHDVPVVGTLAHEWIMAHSELCGMRHANYYAMKNWADVYGGQLGIFLPDTYGMQSFLKDFDLYHAKLYDGVRHDSGCPIEFIQLMAKKYKSFGIPPDSKKLVFSDGINSKTLVREISLECLKQGFKNYSFGIGTWLTNDFDDQPPLNIVIKLSSINNIPVVKLSADAGKICGHSDAVRVALWTHFGRSLDN